MARTTGSKLMNLLDAEIAFLPTFIASIRDGSSADFHSSLCLGRLAEIPEAAGKVRVVGITDIWTQSLLRPLHDAIYRLLKSLVTDGTYDQLAPIRRLYERDHSELYSFDLTAATDRMPVDLQIQVLQCLVNDEFAKHWGNLLVGRPWYKKGVPYYYSVGQPMGALSS